MRCGGTVWIQLCPSGGGSGPELRVVLYLEDGLDAAGVQSVVSGLNSAWAQNEVFAERVDSIEVTLQRAAP